MTPDQCRAARERLNWTRDELRKAADVPLWFIAAFEHGRETPGFLVCWEVAMEAALSATLALTSRRRSLAAICRSTQRSRLTPTSWRN
jgi:DNA-binding XRE family transcriptional regulator